MTDTLKPCAYCDDPMKVNNAGGTFGHAEQGDCILGQLAWQHSPKFIAAWNRRARLIAEAPALAEALESVIQIAEGVPMTGIDAENRITQARAVLARVRGE